MKSKELWNIYIKGNLVTTIIFVIFLILLITSILMNTITNFGCEDSCAGAITFQRIANGKFNLYDACVCYYEDSVKVFVLGEK